MKYLTLVLAVMGMPAGALAQGTVPDLKGTWTGTSPSVVYGVNQHHPGPGSDETPRIRETEFNLVITGQEDRNLWGYNYSKVTDPHEPFAWSLSSNGRTGIGADTDGYYQISVESADAMEVCYAHNRLSPSHSIVTACRIYKRVKR
jgi:hypothetical protein